MLNSTEADHETIQDVLVAIFFFLTAKEPLSSHNKRRFNSGAA